MNRDLASIRRNYEHDPLLEQDVPDNPNELFREWINNAIETGGLDPNAMTLATVDQSHKPHARIVLLKGHDDSGFVFFTNYQSAKGQELACNTQAALVFWWETVERQVRVEGHIEQLSAEESTDYYQSRPRGSQLGAWISKQSQVIPDREWLSMRSEQLAQDFDGQNILPRPEHWGGYRVVPELIEFWQGQPSRLHDRLRYRLNDDQSWTLERLSP